MNKKFFITFFIISMLIIFSGCSHKEGTIENAVEELDYDVLVPSFMASGLELDYAVLEEDLFVQNYANEDQSVFIEISQNQNTEGLNIDRLLEFLEKDIDPYEKIPGKSYLKIGDFIGEYDVYNNSISYMFIPAIPRSEIGEDWYPFYRMTSVGVAEEEFQKVVQSLD